ncbi:cGMP-dependent protein kinase 1-like isoform X1 [Bombus pyrosoma]|uniref:cGMP-dependent protein kinase 1-like isoform X1 n=2 Tax=Bombus pyrosoma TaxID=396416 RepID=UPI001CB9CDA8|nr:cGMP-dependent protein kinase 1-like isoform X1 [Bombus pyrosoma]
MLRETNVVPQLDRICHGKRRFSSSSLLRRSFRGVTYTRVSSNQPTFDEVKRVCFRHAVDEQSMKFPCFPKPSILGQRGSINLVSLSGNESNNVNSTTLNQNAKSPVVTSYKESGEPDLTHGVIRPLPGTTVISNGIGPPVQTHGKSRAPLPPQQNHNENEQDSVRTSDGSDQPANPRGGIIGKTPTPLSEPTPVYEKDEKSKQQITKAILENEFLGNLEENQVEALVDAMYPKHIPPNTLVIREGDMGSHLYVSAEGEFDIYEGNNFQRSFGPGVAFGEIALLYNTKRLRSISVKKGGKVWVLDRSVFLTVMIDTTQKRLEGNIRFLKQVSVLQKLPEPKDHVLAKISDLLRVEFYPAGAKIVTQGEKGDKFFIISGGNVRITKDTEDGDEEELVVLGKGQYFGEIALYDDTGENRRHANVIALAPGVECLTLDQHSFLNYLGGLDEIRNKDWLAEYGKQKQSLTLKKWTSEYSKVTLADLETKATLGVGGFGRVELVILKSDPQKSFALKRLKKKVMVEQQQQEHVLNEKHIMQACDSPFICKLYQTYKDRKYVYFLMEVSLGGDVWTTLQRRRFFDESTTQFMVGCVVEALDHLHSMNIIYRDLKPENLMLDARGYLKLVDFGFSKKIGPSKTWTFAGTPEYVAPEIILNKGHDRAVDYWALGILTHELLIGKPPFRGSDHMSIYNKILKGIEVVGIPNSISRNASSIIKKLLRLSPSERLGYQRNGIQDIRDHKWFNGFNWQALQKLTLPAPIVPTIRNPTDTRNFEKYPPDRNVPPDEFSGWDASF